MTADIYRILLKEAGRIRTIPYLVGGPVRDAWMGRPCADWDLACRRAAKLARAMSRRLRGTFIVLDEQNKIYRVIIVGAQNAAMTLDFAERRGATIERDLARRDFTINAMAADLTQGIRGNATENQGMRRIANPHFISLVFPSIPSDSLVFPVIDPFGGIRDIRAHLIRSVSAKAFSDDPLRLLRAFRFAAQLGFRIDSKTQKSIRRLSGTALQRVARERIREEFMKLLSQRGIRRILVDADRAGLLRSIFPEIESCRRTAVRFYGPGGVLGHLFETASNVDWIVERLESEGGKPGDRRPWRPFHPFSESLRLYLESSAGAFPRRAWLKLGGFLHDIGKPETAKMMKGRLRFFDHEIVGAEKSRKALGRLRFSRQESQMVSGWVRHHMRLGNLAAAPACTDKALSRYLRDTAPEAPGMILVSLADHYAYLPKSRWGKLTDPVEKMAYRLLDAYFRRRDDVMPPRLISGHDIMRRLQLRPGPIIGKLLEAVQDAQADGTVKTKEEALRYARTASQKLQVKSQKGMSDL